MRFRGTLLDDFNGSEALRETTMTIKDMEFTLKTSGVEAEDIETIISHYKKTKASLAALDEILEEMGYAKVFTDDVFGWFDDEEDEYSDSFDYNERNHHKPQWVD